MSLDQIVNVTVSRNTRAPTQRGFGVPILIGYHNFWADRVREYSDQSEMVEDGFPVTHHLYKMATAVKNQDPAPSSFKIGRRENAFTQVVHWIPENLREGFVHRLTIRGTEYTTTNGGAETVGTIVAAMVAETAADTNATVTDGTTHAVLTASAAGVVNEIEAGRGSKLKDVSTVTADDLTEDLEAIVAEDGDFYGALLDNQSAAEIEEFADWLEGKVYLGLVDSADWEIGDAGEALDIASVMKANAYTRTAGLYRRSVGTFGAGAWMGNILPRPAGSYTAAYKTLAGQATDVLSTGQRAAIEAKNWSHYTEIGGENMTWESKTPAGEFIDIIHGIDFSTVRIKESVFQVLKNNAKVPFTDTGAELIRAAVLSVLKQCSSQPTAIFDPASIVCTVPKVLDVNTASRANRTLPNVVYQARLQGAIHKVVVRGEVYV